MKYRRVQKCKFWGRFRQSNYNMKGTWHGQEAIWQPVSLKFNLLLLAHWPADRLLAMPCLFHANRNICQNIYFLHFFEIISQCDYRIGPRKYLSQILWCNHQCTVICKSLYTASFQFSDFQLKSFVDPKPVELWESAIRLKFSPILHVWM